MEKMNEFDESQIDESGFLDTGYGSIDSSEGMEGLPVMDIGAYEMDFNF